MTSDLLAAWSELPHSQRMRRAYELGRDESNRALIDELESGDAFARRLAVQTIHGSRDGQRALRLAADESRLIRHYATKLLVSFGDPVHLEPLFLSSNAATRRTIVQILARQRRRDIVDALCTALKREGGDWQVLASFASLSFVEAHFDEAFARAGTVEWGRLARHYPRFALEKLLQRAQSAKERDTQLLYQANIALSLLETSESDLALQLVQALLKIVALGELRFKRLMALRPEAVAQLVLQFDDKSKLNFAPFVARLEFETLRQLLLLHRNTLSQTDRWFRKIPLEWRQKLWEEFQLGWHQGNGLVSLGILQYLPRAIRQSEALRHLEIPNIAAKPESWWLYAGLLEHEQALERVQPLLGDSDPAIRGVAHRALAYNVRFARPFVGELIEGVRNRGNEQDPVRTAMLNGLVQLPPSAWQEEHLPTLEVIQRQALDARDLSPATATQLALLMVRLLPHFPAWAASQLAILVKERGNISFVSLESRLTDAQMRVIGPQILPTLQSWVRREHNPLLGAMRSFGRRLKAWDEGATLLADFAKNGPTEMAIDAATILAKYRRDVFADLVPELLKIDASWGTQPVVYNYLHFRRQDLWTPALLGRVKPEGRFWTGQTRFVLPLRAGFERWNPAQQALWSQTLTEVVVDVERDTPGAILASNDWRPSRTYGPQRYWNWRRSQTRKLSHGRRHLKR